MAEDLRTLWDREAATFDEPADHGLRNEATRRAWQQLLLPLVAGSVRKIADLGCGTGSLSILFAEAGHHVQGLDFSREMLRHARQKAAAVTPRPEFVEGDAADPPLQAGTFDVVLSRHVLWAMPDRSRAFANWVRLLKPDGQLIMIEGNWSTGAGLTAAECGRIVQKHCGETQIRALTDPALWGEPITDERFLLISRH